MFLTALELAEFLNCRPNQFALMAKRLRAIGYPFEHPPGGCPKVSRQYHDRRIEGQASAVVASNDPAMVPNRAALEALQHGRKNKAA